MHSDEFSVHQKQEKSGMMVVRIRHIITGIEHERRFAFINQKSVIRHINEMKKKVIEKIAEKYIA